MDKIYKDGRVIETRRNDDNKIVKQINRPADSEEKGEAYKGYLNDWNLKPKKSWVNLPDNMVAEIARYTRSQDVNFLKSF